MYINNKVDVFKLHATTDKYGDTVIQRQYSGKLDCFVMDVEVNDTEINNTNRFVKLFSETKLNKDTLFMYDKDLFKVIKTKRFKDLYYVMTGQMIADV